MDRQKMREANIDIELSMQILQTLQESGAAQTDTSCNNFTIPDIDGRKIIDFSGQLNYQCSKEHLLQLREQFPELASSSLKQHLEASAKTIFLNEREITELGLSLIPYFAFGVLNGGSASSYFDKKKNQSFSPELFQLFDEEFHSLASRFASQPKALCPAFLRADKSYGPSFMGLKLRSLLSLTKQLRRQHGTTSPFFQMTSELTAEPLEQYIREGWQRDPADLKPLVEELDWLPIEHIYSEKQPLIATFTKNPKGKWDLFRDGQDRYLPMPGGHGQCFFTLRKLLQKLYKSGTRYISLGNIDNVAYNPHPALIGTLALSQSDGFFVCSYRSSVDIKGGVLLQNKQKGRLNCYDIGVGVDKEILNADKELLFNCAIGYFNLQALLEKIDYIIAELPLRISEQNKDAGHYWQVEQVTWEVMGLLDDILVAAVPKEEYFLAAKLQLEAFVNTGYRMQDYPDIPEFEQLASRFALGYNKVLQRDCKLPVLF